jgi:hypothetical protein
MRRVGPWALVGVLALGSCAWWKSAWPVIRDDFLVAGVAGATAVATNGMSVFTQLFVVTGVTIAAKGVVDLASRDSGETIGAGAERAELERLRAWVPNLQKGINEKVEQLHEVEGAKSAIERWAARLERALSWLGGLGLVWFLVRNREHLPRLRSRPILALWHMILGGAGSRPGPGRAE